MSRKTWVMVGVLSVLIAIWGFFYGWAHVWKPAPLAAQVYPQQTPVPTPTSALAAAGLDYERLAQWVAPPEGTTIDVTWGNMGQRLIAVGAIDLEKFEARYGGLSEEQRAILLGDELETITFTPENIQFWTNVLWALGLTQESDVLEAGPMRQNEARVPLGNYASTGGWTLGSKPATELYSSARLLELTTEQNALVYRVAENVFRPCCGNSAAYPDCNHGMAVLGLLELLAAQGASEDALYRAALTFNAYAFPDTYISLAAYLALQEIPWEEVEPRVVLGADFSSAQGALRVAAAVGPIPGAPVRGGSCGA